MKIDVTENGAIRFMEVYNEVVFEAASGQTLSICMRDQGFEIILSNIDTPEKTSGLCKSTRDGHILPIPYK